MSVGLVSKVVSLTFLSSHSVDVDVFFLTGVLSDNILLAVGLRLTIAEAVCLSPLYYR